MPTYVPYVKVEVAFTTAPGATPTWVDISADAIDGSITRGRNFELDRIEAGTCSLRLNNYDRKYDPTNTASPYYPNVIPMRRLRISAIWNAVTYPLFTGYVERWPLSWQKPNYGEVVLTGVDAMAPLAAAFLPLPTKSGTLATWDNVAGAFTDGATYTAPNYAHNVWAEIVTSFGSQEITLTVTYTNQDGATLHKGTCKIPQSANPKFGLHYPLELQAGDTGVRDITGIATSAKSSGKCLLRGEDQMFVQELSGTRIGNVLDKVGWSAADRNLAAGQSQIQAVQPSGTEQSGLPLIQDAAAAELGLVFISRDGKVTFQQRNYRFTDPGQKTWATFGDGGGSELPYDDLTPTDYSVDRIYNDVRITRASAPSNMRDIIAGSETKYLFRGYAATVPVTTDAEAQLMANYIAVNYSEPKLRFRQMRIEPSSQPTLLYPLVLARDISDKVQIKRRPHGGGPPLSQPAIIEGVTHDFTRGTWATTWMLSSPLTPPLW